jgi:hypothetical protein
MFKFVIIAASLNQPNDLTMSFIYEDLTSVQECITKQPELMAAIPENYEIIGYRCEKVE